jgi:hypothetical protein
MLRPSLGAGITGWLELWGGFCGCCCFGWNEGSTGKPVVMIQTLGAEGDVVFHQ